MGSVQTGRALPFAIASECRSWCSRRRRWRRISRATWRRRAPSRAIAWHGLGHTGDHPGAGTLQVRRDRPGVGAPMGLPDGRAPPLTIGAIAIEQAGGEASKQIAQRPAPLPRAHRRRRQPVGLQLPVHVHDLHRRDVRQRAPAGPALARRMAVVGRDGGRRGDRARLGGARGPGCPLAERRGPHDRRLPVVDLGRAARGIAGIVSARSPARSRPRPCRAAARAGPARRDRAVPRRTRRRSRFSTCSSTMRACAAR